MKEVTEIIEIVFEKIQLDKIVELMINKLSSSMLKDHTISTDSSEINWQSKETLFKSVDQSSDGAIYFNFLDYELEDIHCSRMGFQIIKYKNFYDLNLSMEEKEIREKISVLDLQKRVAFLADALKATSYYCGYEPAMDGETRFFSDVSLGPLKDWGISDKLK